MNENILKTRLKAVIEQQLDEARSEFRKSKCIYIYTYIEVLIYYNTNNRKDQQ